MLSGKIKIDGHDITVTGYDIANTIYLTIHADREICRYFDNGVTTEDGVFAPVWDKRSLEIYLSNAKFEADKVDNVLSDVNVDAITRIASLLRGVKNQCTNRRIVDSDTDSVAYLTPKGGMVLKNGSIAACDIEHNGVQIYLNETDTDAPIPYLANRVLVKLQLADFAEEVELPPLPQSRFYTLDEIRASNTHKNYDWLTDRSYEIVTPDTLKDVLYRIWNHKGLIGFDTETTGLDITFKSRTGEGDQLVGMVFTLEEGQAYYIPLRHVGIRNICSEDKIPYVIEKFFKPILNKKQFITHNGSFDWKVMHIYGINLNIVEDTLVYARLTVWNDTQESLGLKSLTETYLHRDSLELSDFTGGEWGTGDLDFRHLGEEETKLYACADTDNTVSLLNYFDSCNYRSRYGIDTVYKLECLFMRAIGYQEFYGHHVDMNSIDDLKIEIATNKDRTYNLMKNLVGYDFNPGSTKDLRQIVYENLQMPVLKRTEKGAESTDKNTLKRLADMKDENGEPKHPFVSYLLEYRVYQQLESNFVKNIPVHGTTDGYFFSSVNQFLETGRVSVNKPNYQSYNDTVKKYITPRPGYFTLDADYSSVEYRILASMSGEQSLIESFHDPDNDYHTTQASRMFGVPYELVTKSMRSQSKGINFGIPYGMGDEHLGESVFGVRNDENTAKARILREKYFHGQDNVRGFFMNRQALGVQNGYAETFYGRRRYFNRNLVRADSIRRQAGNHPIQGTAADIYKTAMNNLFIEIFKRGWEGKLLLTAFVHDEVVLEVHNSINPVEALSVLSDAMKVKNEGWCPLYIGAGYGDTWYQAKNTEIPIQVQDWMVNELGKWDGWTGDIKELTTWVVNLINTYKAKRVLDYIDNQSTWGKVLSPVENTYAHEVLEELTDGWVPSTDGTPWVLPEVVVQGVPDKNPVKNIAEFGKVFGVQEKVDKANYQEPVAVESNLSVDTNVEVPDMEPDIDEVRAVAIERVKLSGAVVNSKENSIYYRRVANPRLKELITDLISKYPGSLTLYEYDEKTGELDQVGTASPVLTGQLIRLFNLHKGIN